MRIEVRLYATLREHAPPDAVAGVFATAVPAGATLADLIAQIGMAPEQVRVLPITDRCGDYAREVLAKLKDGGVQFEVMARAEIDAIRGRGKVDPILVSDHAQAAAMLAPVLTGNDLILVQGAGNIGKIARTLAEIKLKPQISEEERHG